MEEIMMGHHLGGHHKEKSKGGIISKLLTSGVLLGLGKKLYDEKDKIKDALIQSSKEKDTKK
ncbi:hypothetical protein CBF30_07410 [Vagococcus entomophilus]|uniref:Uncharacterized protein n=2 Tax=Vagococcus entomophilus TaxID=1160095 RepID=A0A430AGM1_9ENTE|nr:hypothetical protein CBF30_07410 [Vagococcus entomophilus]